MFSRPMFRLEYKTATRKHRPFLIRVIFAASLALVGLLVGLAAFSRGSRFDYQAGILFFGRAMFIATIVIELLVLGFAVPAYVASAISGEREKDTLPLLLITRLTPLEIVLTKAFARWLPVTNLLLTGLPILAISSWLAELESEWILAFIVVLTSSAFMATMAILASAQREKIATSNAQATTWMFGWLIGFPMLSVMPSGTTSLWGMLLGEITSLAYLIGLSSPLSLLTDHRWSSGAGELDLLARVGIMIGLQVVFGAILIGVAARRLPPRDKVPPKPELVPETRPECGDDPIYWREFEMANRRGTVINFASGFRLIWKLVVTVFTSILGLVATVIIMALPIGMLVAGIYYFTSAFLEMWQHGYGSTTPFDERGRFSQIVIGGTGLLAFLPALSAGSAIIARIKSERDKKTWDDFLMTPLTGEDIIESKTRAGLDTIWAAFKLLGVLWLAGLVCGVLNPLGIAWATLDLILLARASAAMGLYQGIRACSDPAAMNQFAATKMIATLFHMFWLLCALAPLSMITQIANTLGGWIWSAIFLGALAIPIITLKVTRNLTQRTIERFDEWVGRPVANAK